MRRQTRPQDLRLGDGDWGADEASQKVSKGGGSEIKTRSEKVPAAQLRAEPRSLRGESDASKLVSVIYVVVRAEDVSTALLRRERKERAPWAGGGRRRQQDRAAHPNFAVSLLGSHARLPALRQEIKGSSGFYQQYNHLLGRLCTGVSRHRPRSNPLARGERPAVPRRAPAAATEASITGDPPPGVFKG